MPSHDLKSWVLCQGQEILCAPEGLTAAVIDETLGGLIYMLKRNGELPPGPAFTVHLEVDYKAVRTPYIFHEILAK